MTSSRLFVILYRTKRGLITMKVKVVNNAPVSLKQDPLAETIRILAQIIAKYLASEELTRSSPHRGGASDHGSVANSS